MSAPGELRALSTARRARRGHDHARRPRPPGVLPLGGRDRRGQGRDPRGPAAGRRGRPQRRRPAGAGDRRAVPRARRVVRARPALTTSPPRAGAAPRSGCASDLRLGGRTVDVALPLAGPHFVTNFLAAAAAAHVLGVLARGDGGGRDLAPPRPPPRRGAPARRGGDAPRRLLQLLARGPRGRGGRPRASPRAGGGWPSSATCSSSARPAPPCTTRPARLSPAAWMWSSEWAPSPARSSRALARPGSPRPLSTTSARPPTPSPPCAGLVRPGDAVLVKGSRGVKLEAVVDAIVARFGEGRA